MVGALKQTGERVGSLGLKFDLGDAANRVDELGAGTIKCSLGHCVSGSVKGGFHTFGEDSSHRYSAVPAVDLVSSMTLSHIWLAFS